MEYILEIKQIVDYPRVRIYRDLIRKLMDDKSLSMRGTSNLFEFMVLCSYANFRTSKKKIDAKKYIVGPSEWICSLREVSGWLYSSTCSTAVFWNSTRESPLCGEKDKAGRLPHQPAIILPAINGGILFIHKFMSSREFVQGAYGRQYLGFRPARGRDTRPCHEFHMCGKEVLCI